MPNSDHHVSACRSFQSDLAHLQGARSGQNHGIGVHSQASMNRREGRDKCKSKLTVYDVNLI